MESLRVIRLSDFKGTLGIGLSGAPEVRAAVTEIVAGAERQFYARLLGVTEARRFFEDLAEEEASAVAFASDTRCAATRYAYCSLVEDSQDSVVAASGVFATDSATGEQVAPNRRLAARWNEMCRYLREIRAATDAYRAALRRDLGLAPDFRARDPFTITNPLML